MTNLTVTEVLKKADKLLTPEVWIRGYEATDNKGYPVNATSDEATHFCAVGSLQHIIGSENNELYRQAESLLDNIAREFYPDMAYDIADVNDDIGYIETKRCFAEAIKRREAFNDPS